MQSVRYRGCRTFIIHLISSLAKIVVPMIKTSRFFPSYKPIVIEQFPCILNSKYIVLNPLPPEFFFFVVFSEHSLR